MFVVNPDPFLLPSYRISPFQTQHIAMNGSLAANNFAADYFDNRFGKANWQYTFNGREAIQLALESYQLDRNDLVTILTTSNNFYISSCVTKTIEMFCDWNREILPETKLILVNHEFGYPYENMQEIKALGLPIIEDCCTTFFSQDDAGKVGQYGDFSMYSFPKFFPIQIGGLLVSNKQNAGKSNMDHNQKQYIQNTVSAYLKNEKELLAKRKQIWDYAVTQFSALGFTTRFSYSKEIIPSALVVNNNSIIDDLNALKVYLTGHGIQNSVFYGEDAFFVPVHQNMNTTDIDYFITVIRSFSGFKK